MHNKAVMQEMLIWLFYLPLTAIVIIAIVTIPQTKLTNTLQPTQLDATIFQQRTIQHQKEYTPITGPQEKLTDKPITLLLSPKKFGYKITQNARLTYGNQNFYEITESITIGYKKYQTTYKTPTDTLKIEQVYPEKYERFT